MEKIKKPSVYIIVLNWNGWRETIECLKSLQKLTYANRHVVVVDNNSTDSSIEKILNWSAMERIHYRQYNYDAAKKSFPKLNHDKVDETDARLILIHSKKNTGYAGGNNIGIRFALDWGAEYMFILNNDTVVDPGLLEPLINIILERKKIGILGPKIYFYDKPEVIQSIGSRMNLWTGRGRHIGFSEIDRGQYETIMNANWVSGAAMLISREVFQTTGLLGESFYLCYEENDLCHRARRAGFLIFGVPQAKVWHKAVIGPIKPWMEYYLTRNRLLFMRKNARIEQFYVFFLFYLLGSTTRLFLYCLKGNYRSANALIKGIFHGLAMLQGKKTNLADYGLRFSLYCKP